VVALVLLVVLEDPLHVLEDGFLGDLLEPVVRLVHLVDEVLHLFILKHGFVHVFEDLQEHQVVVPHRRVRVQLALLVEADANFKLRPVLFVCIDGAEVSHVRCQQFDHVVRANPQNIVHKFVEHMLSDPLDFKPVLFVLFHFPCLREHNQFFALFLLQNLSDPALPDCGVKPLIILKDFLLQGLDSFQNSP
jgi:hypothetical protein